MNPQRVNPVFVKVCGMTNLDNALMSIEAGADALGFNFWPGSPRCITPQAAAEITAQLGSGTVKVGVFVDAPAADIIETIRSAGLDLAQIHGELPLLNPDRKFQSRDREAADVSAGQPHVDTSVDAADESVCATKNETTVISAAGREAMAPSSNVPFWHALSAGSELESRVQAALAAGAQAVLIDTPAGARRGGTGRSFDWSLVRGLPGRIVVAGGLGPDNVAAAIRAARPWGVDACSRLELAPGRKDPAKVRAFIQAVRDAELGGS